MHMGKRGATSSGDPQTPRKGIRSDRKVGTDLKGSISETRPYLELSIELSIPPHLQLHKRSTRLWDVIYESVMFGASRTLDSIVLQVLERITRPSTCPFREKVKGGWTVLGGITEVVPPAALNRI